jgi:type VI secretion system lysozyme-related protein
MAYGIQGQPVPLFDRLVEDSEDDAEELAQRRDPMRVYGIAALRESVRKDLERLLNSRSLALMPDYPTVLDYGVADFSHLHAASLTDRTLLAASLRAAIAAYEPRLQAPAVTVESDPNPSHAMRAVATITGRLQLKQMRELVSFEVLRMEAKEQILVQSATVQALPIEGSAGTRSATHG